MTGAIWLDPLPITTFLVPAVRKLTSRDATTACGRAAGRSDGAARAATARRPRFEQRRIRPPQISYRSHEGQAPASDLLRPQPTPAAPRRAGPHSARAAHTDLARHSGRRRRGARSSLRPAPTRTARPTISPGHHTDCAGHRARRRVIDLQNRIAARSQKGAVVVLTSPDHQQDKVIDRRRRRTSSPLPSVCINRDSIADRENILQPVRV